VGAGTSGVDWFSSRTTNYKMYGELLGVDLLNHPELALDPDISSAIAVEYFVTRKGFLEAAETGDIRGATRALNGPGLRGLDQRQCLYDRSQAVRSGESLPRCI
jgi:predicted chitinase